MSSARVPEGHPIRTALDRLGVVLRSELVGLSAERVTELEPALLGVLVGFIQDLKNK